ncbi:MAG: hypothetical protein WBB37_08105 [bacterium]
MIVFETRSRALLHISLLSFLAVNWAYACGICTTNWLIYLAPIFLPVYAFSFLFGLINAIVLKSLSLGIKIFAVAFLALIATTSLPILFIGVLFSSILCFGLPIWHLEKKKKESPDSIKHITKIQKRIYVFIGITFLVSLLIGIIWEVKAIKNFDRDLPEMLTKGVTVGGAAWSKIKNIEDPVEREMYVLQLFEYVGNDNESSAQRFAMDILASWKEIRAVPVVLNAWQEGRIYKHRSIETLRRITGEDYVTIEEWEKWWQEYKQELPKQRTPIYSIRHDWIEIKQKIIEEIEDFHLYKLPETIEYEMNKDGSYNILFDYGDEYFVNGLNEDMEANCWAVGVVTCYIKEKPNLFFVTTLAYYGKRDKVTKFWKEEWKIEIQYCQQAVFPEIDKYDIQIVFGNLKMRKTELD